MVDDLHARQAWLGARQILITEGLHPIGPRRIALFIRPPDANVLEFKQLTEEPADEIA